MPLTLSDDELSIVLAHARPLAPDAQDQFMLAVANALQGREIGVGSVSRVCRALQPHYFSPPDVAYRGSPPKYRR